MKDILELQNAIHNIVTKMPGSRVGITFAPIYILALPLHSFIVAFFRYNEWLYRTEALCCIISILGLIVCFGNRKMFAIAIYFLAQVAMCPNNFNFNSVIYLIVDIVLIGMCLRYMSITDKNEKVFVGENGELMKQCPHCSAEINAEAKYCSKCGKTVI